MALSSRKGQPTKSSAHYAEVPNNETVDNDADVSGVASHDDQTLKKKWKAVVPHESIGTLQDDGLTPMEIETLKTEESTSSSMPAQFIRHWKSSPYAVRCVPPTWTEEIQSRKNALVYSRETNICSHACHSKSGGESMCCCLILSGMVCGNKFIKAKRLGNMVVLREERAAGDFDEEHASQVATARWMLGPYWPFFSLCYLPTCLWSYHRDSRCSHSKAAPCRQFILGCLHSHTSIQFIQRQLSRSGSSDPVSTASAWSRCCTMEVE